MAKLCLYYILTSIGDTGQFFELENKIKTRCNDEQAEQEGYFK